MSFLDFLGDIYCVAFSVYIFLQCLKLKDALLKVVGPKMDLLSNQLQNLMKR